MNRFHQLLYAVILIVANLVLATALVFQVAGKRHHYDRLGSTADVCTIGRYGAGLFSNSNGSGFVLFRSN